MQSIRTAEILSIGSELTTGETRDTNAGDLARDLSGRGVAVGRLLALPDRLAEVAEALRAALARSDLVVTTGGLGPTPDDLTREAIAEVLGERPEVDATLAAHLESLFTRRGMTMPALNVKQAWIIPSATALPNPHGSAPGWWVEIEGARAQGVANRVIVALPGPPAEMRPMWQHEVLPRLQERGLGDGRVVRTLRLAGIGESQVVADLGEELFRAENPEVATYARHDAVDLRITALAADGRTAESQADEVERLIERTLGKYLFAHGEEDWRAALGRILRGRSLAIVEAGTGGTLVALLGGAPWLIHAEAIPSARIAELPMLARAARTGWHADLALALRSSRRGGDTLASVAIDDARLGAWRDRRVVFLGDEQGRRRAALAACSMLLVGLQRRQSA